MLSEEQNNSLNKSIETAAKYVNGGAEILTMRKLV